MDNAAFDVKQKSQEMTVLSSIPADLLRTDIGAEQVPLTFIDFMPECLGTKDNRPIYAKFRSVVDHANQWLLSSSHLRVVRCETIEQKLSSPDYKMDADTCLSHHSSQGLNYFLKGLRVWLMSKTGGDNSVQHLGYITVLPDHTSGNLTNALTAINTYSVIRSDQIFPCFDKMPIMVEKLNRHLAQKPLPGPILSMESVAFKAAETKSSQDFDTEDPLSSHIGSSYRLYLWTLRIFYILGQPKYETIGYHDQLPGLTQSPEGLGFGVKFAPFSTLVAGASSWLQQQQDIQPVTFQTVTLPVERASRLTIFNEIDSTVPGYTDGPTLLETRCVKILRIFYIKGQKSDLLNPGNVFSLTTRLFVPIRRSGRTFETFSKTMQRVITWLKATSRYQRKGSKSSKFKVSQSLVQSNL